MPLDQRLRAGLHSAADGFEPNVERRLAELLTAHRRWRRLRWPRVFVPVIATVVVLVVVAVVALLGQRAPHQRVRPATPVPPPTATVTGTYRAVVNSGSPDARGAWIIQLYPTFFRTIGPGQTTTGRGVSSNATLLTTSMFSAQCGSAPGSYRWRTTPPSPGNPRMLAGTTSLELLETDEARLILTPAHDSCTFRRTVLGRSWLHLVSFHG